MLPKHHAIFLRFFGNRLSSKSNNVAVCPFDFHIAVQQPSNHLVMPVAVPVSTISSIFCSVLQVTSNVAASVITGIRIAVPVSLAPLFGSHSLDLSGLGDPTGSNATASLALRVTGTHKQPHHGKVEIPLAEGGGGCLRHLLFN
jgi:hypothetical protein